MRARQAKPIEAGEMPMLRPEDLRSGLFPAVPVPLWADGRLHAEGLARLVDHLAAGPVSGVAVSSPTGRGLKISSDLRAEVVRAWRRGLGPGRLVIAAAGPVPGERVVDRAFESARDMARQAAELGADAILAMPPVSFRGHRDQDRLILEYHTTLAEVGLPLIAVYLNEARGGIGYGPTVLAQLLPRPEVVGIAIATFDSVVTFQQVVAFIRSRVPEKVIVSGEDRFLGYSLMCGAVAAIVSLGAACPGLVADLLASYCSGDAARFLALSSPVDELGRLVVAAPVEGHVLRLLWCLVHQGVIPAEAAHDPWGSRLGLAEPDQLREALARLGQIE